MSDLFSPSLPPHDLIDDLTDSESETWRVRQDIIMVFNLHVGG